MTISGIVVRRAGAADAAALVRLRAVMLEDMGAEVGDESAPWRASAEAWFTRRLRDPGDFAAFVVDDPELGVVSCAAGTCDPHAPGPTNPSGLQGHVFNICTDRRRRRLGLARACLDALLVWYRTETEVRTIDLNATSYGIELYQSFGFDAPRYPALQLRLGPPLGHGFTSSR
ncbi:GNAT family N-acetyltransferase [Microbispora sitophila]|uniref:GNAT family N-acetyltransferase n=1 Tax=Microbispora sitophila TaxID=2771537 RepID=UPI001D03513B|nr:GNAT family N-acetyltransferase [Microbispora sitophila]